MDVFDEIVMSYLVHEGDTFVSPQFTIKSTNGKVWSCPDFLALNMRKKVASIVEISTASDISGLLKKVNDRNKQWLTNLKEQLIREHILDATWKFNVRVFLRDDLMAAFKKQIIGSNNVGIESLENMCFRWSPEWWKKKLSLEDQ